MKKFLFIVMAMCLTGVAKAQLYDDKPGELHYYVSTTGSSQQVIHFEDEQAWLRKAGYLCSFDRGFKQGGSDYYENAFSENRSRYFNKFNFVEEKEDGFVLYRCRFFDPVYFTESYLISKDKKNLKHIVNGKVNIQYIEVNKNELIKKYGEKKPTDVLYE